MKLRESQLRQRQFEVNEKRRRVTDLETMIGELTRMAEDLDQQIEAEETRTGVRDVNHYSYPPFAKAAQNRRSNLVDTVADLNDRLADARAEVDAALEELRKVEAMGDRAVESLPTPRRGRGLGRSHPRSAPRPVSRAL